MEVVSEGGGEAPDPIKDAPVMDQGLLKYWNAFVLLSRSRTAHFAGSNPIALSEIKAFFDIFEINDMEEREDFVYFIKELDAELLTLERAEQKTT